MVVPVAAHEKGNTEMKGKIKIKESPIATDTSLTQTTYDGVCRPFAL